MKIEDIFDKCAQMIVAKGHDYTTDAKTNRHENFQRSETISDWFTSPLDRVYITLIGTKLARLATLLNGKSPKNESILDSFIDLVNYCALWADARTEMAAVGEKDTQGIYPNDPNPHRSTNCYFCGCSVHDAMKIISGQYRQAHVRCYNSCADKEILSMFHKPDHPIPLKPYL